MPYLLCLDQYDRVGDEVSLEEGHGPVAPVVRMTVLLEKKQQFPQISHQNGLGWSDKPRHLLQRNKLDKKTYKR